MKKIVEIEDLVSEEISGVGFIRDYVEFYFDGPIIRCLSDPVVTISNDEYRFPEPGSRDALCQLVGETIQALKLDESRSLRLEISGGRILVIPLDSGSRWGAETMHFVVSPDSPIQIW